MHKFYVKIPYEFDYRFDQVTPIVEAVLMKLYNTEMKFIVNNIRGVCKADIYEVRLSSIAHEDFFL